MKKYQEITPISRSEAQLIFAQCAPEEIALTLLRLAYHDPDWMWVQDLCVSLSTHHDKSVRQSCVICFSHLARIHGKLERQKVMLVLNRLLHDPEVKGEVEVTMDELEVFLKE
jgi:hypothetical protein